MKEIRIHGRGGQGSVTAAEVIVYAAVHGDQYAACFPYFGFEKKGGPVTAFARIDNQKIREKCQVYHPDCLIVIDPTLMEGVNVFKGIKKGGVLVINRGGVEDLDIPENVETVAYIDASAISEELLGRNVPNTVLLGAFAKATGWVEVGLIAEKSAEIWGEKNAVAVQRGYDQVTVVKRSREK